MGQLLGDSIGTTPAPDASAAPSGLFGSSLLGNIGSDLQKSTANSQDPGIPRTGDQGRLGTRTFAQLLPELLGSVGAQNYLGRL